MVLLILELISTVIFFHGITFLWIITQCAKKPAEKTNKSVSQPPKSTASAVPTPSQQAKPAEGEPDQLSLVPPGPASFVQNTNQTTMGATSAAGNFTQTQKTVTQASQVQPSQVSEKKPTVTDDGGYDNLNPNSKPIESVK